jgi:alpha-galactosidase
MMCLAVHRAVPNVNVVGLCHSVQGTSQMLAGVLKRKIETIDWDCAGINHLAWFTKFNDKKTGEDLYPKLMALAANRKSKFANEEPVRTDMMLAFGAFITESSGHLSEYVPYYRKRKDLRRKYLKSGYRGEESFYANNWPNWRRGNDEWRDKLATGVEKVDLNRSHEYGGFIIEAIEKDAPFTIHGNVSNAKGLIGNLPTDGCVEVACKVDAKGWTPVKYGDLPRQMAGVCDMDMRFFDVGVEACLNKSVATAVHAMLLDPLTAAVLSPVEIKAMTLEMFEAEKAFLPGFA